MQLHNTSQYAIRILSYIAKDNDYLYNAKELSGILEIPHKFLTKIMTELVKYGFILSIRGREGGYKLAKPTSDITILEILEKFNDQINDEQCILGIGVCDSKNKCALHDQWVQPKSMIKRMFEETTLEKLEGEDFKP
jgi:Rrf2 family protein